MREKKLTSELNIGKNLEGIKFLIGSGLAFSLMSVCVKAIGGRIPISELVFARATISIIITSFYLYKKKIHRLYRSYIERIFQMNLVRCFFPS